MGNGHRSQEYKKKSFVFIGAGNNQEELGSDIQPKMDQYWVEMGWSFKAGGLQPSSTPLETSQQYFRTTSHQLEVPNQFFINNDNLKIKLEQWNSTVIYLS
jgi:hypothetical protein